MCVIIVKRATQKLDSQIALKTLCLNPHGFGIQLLDTGEIHKTMDLAYAYELLMSERPYVAHARLTTVGETNLENVHPARIDEHNTLFHNGTVQVPLKWGKDKSDTRFIAETLSQTPWQSWKSILSLTDSRFAYIRKTKKDKLYVNKVGLWHRQDGVWYSKDNVLGNRTIIAVYGTLRRGHHNHHLIRNAMFLGEGTTANEYKMICRGIPFVRPEANQGGHRITVELYALDKETLARVDSLEGHPDSYKRSPTTIYLDNGLTAEAELYFHDRVEDSGNYYSDFNTYREVPVTRATPMSQLFNDKWEQEEEEEVDLVWDAAEGRYFDMSRYAYVDFEHGTEPKDPDQYELF